ncbi:LamG-like jellyroll fold domain-containing protein [Bremerella sp. P1]|uniref:LamG-like jellyroll fold domain-containing protein n=1 Tax=Bremerella sp. P1 TaxID=3026424 RepID=UPI0023677ADB|nr:LamG-like jellyroll fold domain-containing protein [Bremerella sp. P1]WDI41065.1 hypothetical protein PSR63_21595 [Bremerella sp. P1]
MRQEELGGEHVAMSSEAEKEFASLISAFLDDKLSIHERKTLADLVSKDTELQRRYVESCQTHAMMSWEYGVIPETLLHGTEYTGHDVCIKTKPPTAIWCWQLCTMASWILLLACGAWIISQPPSVTFVPIEQGKHAHDEAQIPWDKREVHAFLTRTRGDALLTVPSFDIEIKEGESLRRGRYYFSDGLVEITFNSNVEVIIESPAEFEIISDQKLLLHLGRASATVPLEGIGFMVETPSIALVDYGTEFSVDVSPDRASEVHVFSGEVGVTPKLAPEGHKGLRLITNQATRVGPRSGIAEGIDIDRDRFVRNLADSQSSMSRYEEYMSQMRPVHFFKMEPSANGMTLPDYGSRQSEAVLLVDQMEFLPYKPGRVGNSLYLRGPTSHAYAKVPEFLPISTGQMTVCAWVKADSRPHWAAIAKHWAIELDENNQPYGMGGQFHFGLHNHHGDLEVQVRDKSKSLIKVREHEPLPLGTWQHVAFVVNGEALTLYRNGKEVGSSKCDGLAVDGPVSLGIGAKLTPDCTQPDERNPGFWHGRIDELTIFDRALSAESITQVYEAALLELDE